MTAANVALIERFYRAFDEGDGETMAIVRSAVRRKAGARLEEWSSPEPRR